MDIAALITSARERAGLTQHQLAVRAGTSQSAVARLEAGQGNPGLDTIQRLLHAAGCELQLTLIPRTTTRDPVIEAYKAGVDRTLLRENLGKTVDRRLRDAEALRKAAGELRGAVRASRRGK